MQVKILGSLLGTVKSNLVPVNLWPEGQTYPNNLAFVRSHLLQLLSTSFPNMTEAQVQRIVDKMFELVDNMTAFKNHCRDFLVQVRLLPTCLLFLLCCAVKDARAVHVLLSGVCVEFWVHAAT
jgi:hypothetical protein